MVRTSHLYTETPIGILKLEGTDRGVASVTFVREEGASSDHVDRPLLECEEQLRQYFFHDRTAFHSLELAYVSTDFQERVWQSAMSIPYGETVNYKDLARDVGNPKAARAVGSALNKNPLLLIVPCHRIMPASLSGEDVGGFAAGEWRKKWLLRHEAARALT